jgi:site-specific recombinase XerD
VAENKSDRTLQCYEEGVRQFCTFLEERRLPTEVGAIRTEHVDAFMVHLRDDLGRKPSTLANRFASLQQFFRWAEDVDALIPRSPMAKMAKPTVPVQPVAYLTDAQTEALVKDCATGGGFEDRRDEAIIRVFIDTGCRLGEVADLRLEDVDLVARELRVVGKGGSWRRAYIGPKTVRALDRYGRVRADHPHAGLPELWLGRKGPMTTSGIGQMLDRRGGRAGIAHIHPHMFRHGFARYVKARGESDETVMQLGGWRSADVMRRYGTSAADERARDAHRNLAPADRF